MLSKPNNRAFSHGFRFIVADTVRAIRFHCNGELSIQNSAICVWSGVRALGVVTPSPPRALTSSKSNAYFLVSISYGRIGGNCPLWVRTKGVTFPHPGANAKGKPGVKRYSPGLVPCG